MRFNKMRIIPKYEEKYKAVLFEIFNFSDKKQIQKIRGND